MALDAGIGERSIFVATEREYRLVHLLGVEYLESHKQMEVFNSKPGDREKEFGLEFGDDVLKRVLAEIREVHESGDACGKFDEFLLNLLPLGFVFLFLAR